MKNIILLNSRSLHLYDFKNLRDKHNLRISTVLFEDDYKRLSYNTKNSLDEIHVLDNHCSMYPFPSFPIESLTTLITKEISQFNNTWIVGADEINNLSTALLRKVFNIQGTSYSIILNYKNKAIQKRKLNENNIRVPKFREINKESLRREIKIFYRKIVNELGNPFIIKPVDMFGTIGVKKIHNYKQFQNYFSQHLEGSLFIAEEYINAQLYHCDFIVQKNNYIFMEVSEYLHDGLAFINGSNHGSILLLSNHTLREKIINLCIKINTVLGLESGCGHFEVFATKEQDLIFLEAAARPAGSAVPLVFSKTFKMNYLNTTLLAEIEEDIDPCQTPSEYYFWTFFPQKPGIIKQLSPPPIKSSYKLEWYVNVGDVSSTPTSIADKSGYILVKNKDYQILRNDFNFIRRFEAIRVEKI